jgi:hypothetical protein
MKFCSYLTFFLYFRVGIFAVEANVAMTEDLIAYNIIPLDGPTMTNAIVNFHEVSLFYPEIKD